MYIFFSVPWPSLEENPRGKASVGHDQVGKLTILG